MLENPEKLRAMVKASGAVSTDLQSQESVDHLCAKCDEYARTWAPDAARLWSESQAGKKDRSLKQACDIGKNAAD